MRIDSDRYECDVCMSRRDYYDEKPLILDGDEVCPECREMCDGCGEYISDWSISCAGPIVQFRDYAVRGQLRHSHASCAAITFLTYLDPHYNYDHSTREEIATAVELHTAQAIVMQKHEEAQCIPTSEGWYQVVKHVPVFWLGDIIEDGRSEREAWMDASKAVQAVTA